MDPITILTIVQSSATVTAQIVTYLKDVKIASKQRAQLRAEAQSLVSLLTDLKEDVEAAAREDDTSLRGCLETLSGPLKQFQADMEEFATKMRLEPGRLQSLRWSFDKQDVLGVLGKIERTKTLVLLALERDQSGLLRELQKAIRNIENDVNAIRTNQMDEKYEKALHWLSSANHAARKSDFSANLEPGTRDWFIQSKQFKSWLENRNETIVCVGAAAVGKSHLFTAVIEHLERSAKKTNFPVLYVYCTYQDKESQTADTIMASLLQQLAKYSDDVAETVLKMHDEHRLVKTRPSASQLSSAVITSLERLEEVYILVDALDEIVESGGLRNIIIEQLQALQPFSNLFITTRPIMSIVNSWTTAVNMEITAHDEDLRKCIDLRLETDRSLSRNIGKDQVFRDLITSTIIEKCQGLFLLAPLYLNSLASKISKMQMRRALQNLPLGLDEMYIDTLRRISNQGEEAAALATRALQFVTFAFRSLTILDLQTAVAIEQGMTSIDDECLSDEETLLSVCGGLLTVDSESYKVRLVHYTTKDFLQRYQDSTWDKAHAVIAKSCITYLSFDMFANWDLHSTDIANFFQKLPFLEYATMFWGHHAKLEEAAISQEIDEFFSKGPQLWNSTKLFSFIHEDSYPDKLDNRKVLNAASLHSVAMSLAVFFSLTGVFQSLLDAGVETASPNPLHRMPLKAAVILGKEDTMLQLFQNHSDDDRAGILPFAARYLDYEAFQKLLRFKPNVNVLDERGRSPLHCACANSKEEIVAALIRSGANTMSRDYRDQTPLHVAASYGKPAMAANLLDNGADIDACDRNLHTPLNFATLDNNYDMVYFLLLRGAKISLNGDQGSSTANSSLKEAKVLSLLFRAILGLPDESIAQFLSEHAIFSTYRDEYGGTFLHELCETSTEDSRRSLASKLDLIRLFIHAGVDIDAVNARGETALHIACYYGYTGYIQTLLESGASPNIVSCEDESPLDFAFTNYEPAKAIKLLIKHGADVLRRNSDGLTPLQLVVWHDRREAAEALLETRFEEQTSQIHLEKLRAEGFEINDDMLKVLHLEGH